MANRVMDAPSELGSRGVTLPPVFPRMPRREMLGPDHADVKRHPKFARANQITDTV